MLSRAVLKLLSRPYLSIRGRASTDELRSRTTQLLREFQTRVEELTQEEMDAHPIPGKWSGSEIAFHAVNSAKSLFRLADTLRKGDAVPDLDRSSMGRTKNVSRQDLLELCRKVQDQTAQFDFSSGSSRTCAHPFFGPQNARKWLVINLIHLERHLQQLNRIIRK